MHGLAFAPSEVEARLVGELRDAGELVPEPCPVATDDGEAVAHMSTPDSRGQSP